MKLPNEKKNRSLLIRVNGRCLDKTKFEEFKTRFPAFKLILELKKTELTPDEKRLLNFIKICQNTPQLCWGDEWPPLSPGGRGLG